MSSATAGNDIDVLVVGGGPVGACAAALLARPPTSGAAPMRVAVLEPRRPQMPVPGSPLDSRVVAISRASERILVAVGAWSRIPAERVAAYERMRVWHESVAPTSQEVLQFDAAEVGEPNLGYILEGRALQAALLDTLAAAGGSIEAGELRSVRVHADAVEVETSNSRWRARLLIGADGAQSAVRASLGIAVAMREYRETAVIATIATERAHSHTAWQRFMRNGTLALLPLADGTSSIVWSADESVAADLMSRTAPDFERELDRASDLVLGRTRLLGERVAFELKRLTAQHYAVNRCALIGDAAHVVHPLAGQGVNLGLLDAAALADLVLAASADGEDPGALGVL